MSYEPLFDNVRRSFQSGVVAYFFQQTRMGRFLVYLRSLPRRILGLVSRLPVDQPGAIVFVAFTRNQRAALTPLVDHLRKSGHKVSFHLSGSAGQSPAFDADCWQLKRLEMAARFWAIPFLPCLLWRMFVTRGFAGRSYCWALDQYWYAYGLYLTGRRWFRRCRPSALVVSNDHVLECCTLLRAARDESVPTIYLPHAPVTERFPRLTMDFALLEGRRGLDIYAAIGATSTRVFLVGIPRFDNYANHPNLKTKAEAVGYCVGLLDEPEASVALLRHLLQSCRELRYVIRIHPRSCKQTMERWQSICRKWNLDYSDSTSELSFEFLKKVDAVIAGGSGVILEAALVNVTPILYAFAADLPDWYGFAREGLCPMLTTPEDVSMLLQSLHHFRPSVRERARRHNVTLGTPYEGRSAELAAKLIWQIATRRNLPPTNGHWQRVDTDDAIKAYEIANESSADVEKDAI